MRALGIFFAIAVGAYVFNSTMEADRDAAGAIVSAGNIDAFQMRVGDCFDDMDQAALGEEVQIATVPGVPCEEPHDNEVFAVFDVDAPSFPGDRMADMAFEACLDRFEPFVGRDYMSSSLDIFAFYPSHDSWHQRSDREVVCALFDVDLDKLVGSAKGLAL